MGQIISPSNAGFSPREIRRQDFQEAVAATLDRQAHAITATREFMADLSVRLDDLHTQVTAAKADIVALAADHATEKQRLGVVAGRFEDHRKEALGVYSDHADALTEVRNDFYGRSFLGRLRWFLTGK